MAPQGLDQQPETLTRKDARFRAMATPPLVDSVLVLRDVPTLPEADLALVPRDAVPTNPMEQLDAMLEPTPEWGRLREILMDRSAWVRNTIIDALSQELSRSFQCVVQQIQAVRDVMREAQETLSSDDAIAVSNFFRDIQPSNIAALQRAADGVHEDAQALRNDLAAGDLQTLKGRADRIATRAKRFRDKYAEVRLHLISLHAKLQQLAKKCEEHESNSAGLIAETEGRREWWWNVLATVNCLLLVGSAIVFAGSAGTGLVAGILLVSKTSALATSTAAVSAAKAAATAATAKAGGAAAAAGSGASSSATAGAGVAAASSATAAGATAAAAVGAPAATVLGSEVLGSMAVSAGLMATPAAPVGVVLGVGAAAAAGATLLLNAFTAQAAAASAAEAASRAAAASAATAHVTDALGIVSRIKDSIASLSAVMGAATAFVAPAAIVLALGLLGYAGRDLVKSLLGRLWESVIRQHEQSKEWFGHMKQRLREAAEKLRTVQERSEALEECLDLVVETAEEISETAEDAQLVPNGFDADALLEHIDRLCSRCNNIPPAFEDLQQAARELEIAARPVQLALPAQSLDLLGASNDNQIIPQAPVQREAHEGALRVSDSTVRESAPLVSGPATAGSSQEIDESARSEVSDDSDTDVVGWILVESPGVILSDTDGRGCDCLPRATGLLDSRVSCNRRQPARSGAW